MASNIQFTREASGDVPVAGAATQVRVFVDDADGQLKLKNDAGEISNFAGNTNIGLEATLQTTDATPTVLASVGTTTDQAMWVEVVIVGRDTTANEAAAYKLFALFDNASGTVSQVGATQTLASLENDASWDAVFNVNGTSVEILVTGDATNAVEWKVTGTYNRHG